MVACVNDSFIMSFMNEGRRVAIADLEISRILVRDEWYTVLLVELKQ